MASLRIRVELNRGRIGIPLGKLASVVDRMYKFFNRVCEDVSIEGKPEDWLAQRFENGSVAFDITNITVVEQLPISNFNRLFKKISSFNSSSADDYNDIPRATILQYADIAKPIDVDEMVRFGLYADDGEEPSSWHELTKEISVAIEEHFKEPEQVQYQGSIHGIIHSLIKEGDRPHLNVRDLSTQKLVKCFYKKEMYDQIVALLKKREAVVFISGLVRATRTERKIESVIADSFKVSDEFTEKDFDDFFGCAPDITGNEATEDFISRIREDAH